MQKAQWDDLPCEAKAAVEERCSTALKAESANAGIMPGLAARLHLHAGGSVFVKAVREDHPAVRMYRREEKANRLLPADVPAPRMLWSGVTAGWLLMLFQFVENGRRPDLAPGSHDLPGVLETVGRLRGPGDGLPPVSVNLRLLRDTATALLAEDLEGPRWRMYADAIDGLDMDAFEGDRLLHYDLHAGNLLASGDAVYVLDWSFACHGAGWIDAALLLPRLVEAGHSPAEAEALVSGLPGWADAPPRSVTALLALWAMFREHKALHGPESMRTSRARAAEAGRALVAHMSRREAVTVA